ncbi:MAG TPA: ABC transporter permease [Thermomicrobiaceae bacterium]|nr:ABC transporter permease [Thermomicrobiaceae bacterium]
MSDTAQQQTTRVPGALAGQRADLAAIERAGRHRLLRRFLHNKPGVFGLAVIVILVLLAILSPWIAPYNWQAQDIAHRFANPSLSHLLGTDELGRDILSRILYGGRYSLTIGFAAVGVSFAIGTLIGTVAGFYRKTDGVIMRLIDIMMAFPGILLAIAIVAALGPGLINVIVAIGINEIPGFARITRSLVLSLREREFVTAANLMGGSDTYIVRRHVLVNLVSPIIVYASLRISTAVLVGATLSFLGLGIQPPIPEWGAMVSTARDYISIAPYDFLFPTLAIFITVVAFNLLGDTLRDTLDPTIRDA